MNDPQSRGNEKIPNLAAVAQTCRVVKEVWGPITWTYLHCMVGCLPDHLTNEDRKKSSNTVYSVLDSIPCTECHQHAAVYLSKHPLPTWSATRLPWQEWMKDFHSVTSPQHVHEEWTVAKIDAELLEIPTSQTSTTTQPAHAYKNAPAKPMTPVYGLHGPPRPTPAPRKSASVSGTPQLGTRTLSSTSALPVHTSSTPAHISAAAATSNTTIATSTHPNTLVPATNNGQASKQGSVATAASDADVACDKTPSITSTIKHKGLVTVSGLQGQSVGVSNMQLVERTSDLNHASLKRSFVPSFSNNHMIEAPSIRQPIRSLQLVPVSKASSSSSSPQTTTAARTVTNRMPSDHLMDGPNNDRMNVATDRGPNSLGSLGSLGSHKAPTLKRNCNCLSRKH
jgi:hypothetical protein